MRKNCPNLVVLLVLLCFFVSHTNAQITLAYEDFEGSGNWNFTTTHTNGNSYPDTSISNSPTTSWRLDNWWNDNSTTAFDNFDLTGYTGVQFSIAYASQGGPDNGDDLYLDYGYFSGGSWTHLSVQLIDGGPTDNIPFGTVSNTGQANPFVASIPDSATDFYATVRGTYVDDSGGDHDQYYIDDVYLTANPPADPIPQNDQLSVIVNSTSGVSNQIDVFSNDEIGSDGGDSDNVSLLASPSNGTVTEISDGVFEYVPNTDFYGSDSFTYTLCDALGDCASATVNVTVNFGTCVPVSNSNGSHYITNFSINGETNNINNTTGDDGGYGDYTSLTPVDVFRGSTYTGNISVNGGNMGWAIHIDYNKDGDFNDPNELAATINGEGLSPLSFTVPLGALSGNTLMRVGARRYWSSNDPCGQTPQPEEFEDYLIQIKNDPISLQVFGNNNYIPAGSTTPSSLNYTDFGVYDINSGSITRTYTVLIMEI